jgi:hypothetical protein
MLSLIVCAGSEPPLAALKPDGSPTSVHSAHQTFHHDPLHRCNCQRPAQCRADTSPGGRRRTQATVPPATSSPADDGNGNYTVHNKHQKRIAQQDADDHALLHRRQRLVEFEQPGLSIPAPLPTHPHSMAPPGGA